MNTKERRNARRKQVEKVLKNKVAIITGGGGGIGRAIAQRFALEGADCVVVGRTFEKVKQTAEDVETIGARSLALRTDVSVSTDVAQMVKETVSKFGRVDILVNTAGIIIRKRTFDYTEEDWDKTLNINLKSVFLCCKEVVPVMLRQGKGKIVSIASIAGQVGFPRSGGAYGASKAGIINLTAHMAAELAPYKINVNAVSPGPIQTPMNASTILETPEKRQRIIEHIPYGRLGQPEDVASAVLFLASDQSDFITGSVIVVDGGVLNHTSA